MRTIAVLGAPTFGQLKAFYGHAWHWTAGGVGLEGAKVTARWQAGAGNTQRGSYHGILTCDPWPNGDPVLVATVPLASGHPADLAVGGISTERGAAWRLNNPSDPTPARRLPIAAQQDPNAYLRQYAIAGGPADVAAGYPAGLIRGAVELIRLDEARHAGIDPIQTGHRDWQLDKADPGATFVRLVLDAYAEAQAPTYATREERLEAEVIGLREAHPLAAAYWAQATGLPYQPREPRLAAEVLFLRLVALNGGRYR